METCHSDMVRRGVLTIREQTEISARLEAAQEALSEAQETGSGNTRTLQNGINELTAAQEANAQQIAELEEASRE